MRLIAALQKANGIGASERGRANLPPPGEAHLPGLPTGQLPCPLCIPGSLEAGPQVQPTPAEQSMRSPPAEQLRLCTSFTVL